VEGNKVNVIDNATVIRQERSWGAGLRAYQINSSSIRRAELLIGQDVGEVFAANLRLEAESEDEFKKRMQRVMLGLVIAARQQGIPLERLPFNEHGGLNAEQIEALKEKVTEEIVSALIGEKEREGRVPGASVFTNHPPGERSVLPFGINLRPDDFEGIRILGELCGLDRQTAIDATWRRINELEKKMKRDPLADTPKLRTMVEDGTLRLTDHGRDSILNQFFPPVAASEPSPTMLE
jgi:hypothetical protein